MSKKGFDESQLSGMASSYARKYALNGLFCIDDTKDSDAVNDGSGDIDSIKEKVLKYYSIDSGNEPTQKTIDWLDSKSHKEILDLLMVVQEQQFG